MLRSQQRSISYSVTAEFNIFFSDLTRKVRLAEELLSACLHMLMHECKNPDPVVNAQCVHSRKTQLRVRPKWAIRLWNISHSKDEQWNPDRDLKSHMDIQSYNMFTVLKYAINEILCVSVWNDNKVLFSPMFFQMFLNAIAVLYDYPGGGILSSWISVWLLVYCMGRQFLKCNIAESCQIVIFF